MKLSLKRIVPTAALATVLVVAGCSNNDDGSSNATHHEGTSMTSSQSQSQSPGAAQFDDADVAFVEGMYPHHAQAVHMAQMVPGRTDNAELLALAAAIEKAQAPEMDQMTAMLKSWGKPAPSADHGDTGSMHGGTQGAMPGMMSDEDMSALMAANGPAFDSMWLTMMIEHHDGAIEMSQTEIAEGTNPEAKKLAEQIIATQQAEIAQMNTMLQK